ncbi:hypothetical protein ABK040_004448 [Willaertia magna]
MLSLLKLEGKVNSLSYWKNSFLHQLNCSLSGGSNNVIFSNNKVKKQFNNKRIIIPSFYNNNYHRNFHTQLFRYNSINNNNNINNNKNDINSTLPPLKSDEEFSKLSNLFQNIQFSFSSSSLPFLLSVYETAMKVLSNPNPEEKIKLTREFQSLENQSNNNNNNNCEMSFTSLEELFNYFNKNFTDKDYMPARPELPILEEDMKKIPVNYKQAGVSLPVMLLHNLAHIELNAIDLSWHTCLMSLHYFIKDNNQNIKQNNNNTTITLDLIDFVKDFISVAKDEARHFNDLNLRLKELSSFYGKIPSHKSIWSLANKTQYHLIERIIIGNLVLEGRGLDSTDRLVSKMIGSGDMKSSKLVQGICKEEENHVRIGMKWFRNLSNFVIENNNLNKLGNGDNTTTTLQKEYFQQVTLKYYGPLPAPINYKARESATMERDWYEEISRVSLNAK